jgi:hypothetical protein
MSHVLGLRTTMFAGVILIGCATCGKDQIQGPAAEVKKTDVKLDLPNVPAFDLPPAPGDGAHAVKELRVKGKKLFETDITVHGFITWQYDCATAVRKPDETDKDLQKRLDEDPTLCERPKFYIGDTKETPAEKSLWVVDVPRPYNKLEMERMKKPERTLPDRCEPKEDPKKNICPPYAVGDEVTITGTFKTSSPHSERNSDGLLVYKKMKNVTQTWETPDLPPPPGAPGANGKPAPAGPPPPATKPSPSDLVNGKNKKG